MSLEQYMKIKKHLNVKAAMEAMIEKEYNKAIELYSSAIASDPNDWKIYVQRCRCYHTLNRLDDALKDAQMAIDLNEDQMSGHYRKGLILLEKKQFRSAEHSFQNALKCEPNDKNCKIQLKETHKLFIEEFGFKGEEVDLLADKYSKCSDISDALISGKLLETLASLQLSSDSVMNAECPRSITTYDQSITDSDSIKTANNFDNNMTITSNSSLVDFNVSSLETSLETSMNTPLESTLDCDGIRRPKSMPLFRVSVTPVMSSSICSDRHSTVSGDDRESDDNSSQTPQNKSRVVKTRPQIFRSIKT